MTALTGTGIWSMELRYGDPAQIPEAAAELDELGYNALWFPDAGGDIFGAAETLLAATRTATVATGILSLWMHSAEETAAEHTRLNTTFGDRFLVGIGVSHARAVDAEEPGRYRRPLDAMASFLDRLDAAPNPLPAERRVLAALGPKMLELARDRAAGAAPFNGTPEHTAQARQSLGPDSLLLPEQAVALITDATRARELGRSRLAMAINLPNYANNLRRLGFGDDDFAGGGSDRLVDALLAWGDVDAVAARVQAHRDAGANHVCVQVISESEGLPLREWRELAPALVPKAK